MRFRRSFAIALLLAISTLGVSIVVPASAGADALSAAPSTRLDWKRCGDGIECAKVTVPLDY